MSEERGCPVLFLPNVMYWLLPIVADVLFSVLSTEKWACAGQSSRQQACFPSFLRIPSTSSALLTLFCCRLFTGSQMDPALHPYLASCHLYWEFLTCLSRGVDCKSFLLHGHLCRVAVSSAFSSPDREPIFPLMWQRTRNTSAGLSLCCLCACSHVVPNALLSAVNCVWAFPRELCCHPRPPADIPEDRILWASGCLGTVAAGIGLGATVPPHHPHLERLTEKSDGNTCFKIKSSALYIYNVYIIYFPLCCILWEFYP